jgi:hypothetical protein
MIYWKICLAWLVVYAVGTAVLLMDLMWWRPG